MARRIGALIALTVAALAGVAHAQSAHGAATTTRADSVWLAPVDPQQADEPNRSGAPADESVQAIAPMDSVW
ncbi:hypothetical protein ACN2WE_06390 [Streptomyces sp. cg28]|uniref:hypothetical protein n=1 Tax=unclassified Streptomyces TaxID=2593676 RepID=UPI0011B93EAF|nr:MULTISPECIES: hypothetical protein [unclassified Streptomyces]MYT75675.1 hypothetical protein [Streptomyces sp. SID8367]